jgi:hypothetical protein
VHNDHNRHLQLSANVKITNASWYCFGSTKDDIETSEGRVMEVNCTIHILSCKLEGIFLISKGQQTATVVTPQDREKQCNYDPKGLWF